MFYGVDYYPEHDPQSRWATDAKLIAEAGFTVVRLAEFAWSRLERQAGKYEFAWLDRAIDLLAQHGLKIVLGTPTAAPPQWLAEAYPEILHVDQHGRRASAQSRRFVCMSSPLYRAHSAAITQALAEHYGKHPAVVAWQVDNEFGCHNSTRCFCESCQAAFRTWLERRYSTLDQLNAAWGTVFWSREYSAWSQVLLPLPTSAEHSPSHVLDSYRFASDMVGEYQHIQIAILRDFSPGRPICHNYMGNFDQIDYAALSQPLDVVAWDNYVPDGVEWYDTARYHDTMRGFKHRPFWVIESPPAHVNWTTYNPDMRFGEARLRSLQAVAHGADGMFYFQWRAFRAGSEQYHSAILPHDGIPGRLFHEAAALGTELATLAPLLNNTAPQPKVAILNDMDSYWALQHQPHSALLADPQLYLRPWYTALCRRNVPVEFCQPTDDLSAYALVIAPSLHVVTDKTAANLREHVEAGGTLVIGPRSGFKEPTNQVTSMPLPGLLAEIAGVRVVEWATLLPNEQRTLEPVGDALGETTSVMFWRELLELQGAEPLARYTSPYDAGHIAVTRHRVGAGETFYLGGLGADLIDMLVEVLLKRLGLRGLAETPAGVEVCERVGEGHKLLFLMNHTDIEQIVPLNDTYRDALDGSAVGGTLRLAPVDVRILVQQKEGSDGMRVGST